MRRFLNEASIDLRNHETSYSSAIQAAQDEYNESTDKTERAQLKREIEDLKRLDAQEVIKALDKPQPSPSEAKTDKYKKPLAAQRSGTDTQVIEPHSLEISQDQEELRRIKTAAKQTKLGKALRNFRDAQFIK